MNNQISCPACGESIAEGNLAEHIEECADLRGSGTMKSSFVNNPIGPVFGESARKPSLDSYDRRSK